MFYLILFIVFLIFIPNSAYAWGPGVHIGVSLSIIDQLDSHTVSIILANLNEYLYGSLAPDFILGKKYSNKEKHSHSWKVGFGILSSSKSDAERAFGLGYLTHLASDSVAHGIMIPKMVEDCTYQNMRHFYIEAFADACCDKSYKDLAKKILNRYNAKLDNQFKRKVDSILFSFSVSKVLFKGMARISFNKQFESLVLSNYLIDMFRLKEKTIKGYVELSKEFSIDVLKRKEDSKVINISAISK